jgi:hypothetical protein
MSPRPQNYTWIQLTHQAFAIDVPLKTRMLSACPGPGSLLVNGGTGAGSLYCLFTAEKSNTCAASAVNGIEPVSSMGGAQYCVNQPTNPFHEPGRQGGETHQQPQDQGHRYLGHRQHTGSFDKPLAVEHASDDHEGNKSDEDRQQHVRVHEPTSHSTPGLSKRIARLNRPRCQYWVSLSWVLPERIGRMRCLFACRASDPGAVTPQCVPS